MNKKMKTKSSAKKRFKKVGDGTKIKRSKAYRRHHFHQKTKKRKRNLRKGTYVSAADYKRIARLMPG